MDMKKSLYVRFAFVAIILVAWLSVLYPLKDRSFLGTFIGISSKQIEKYASSKVETEKEAAQDYRILLERMLAKMEKSFNDAITLATSPEVNKPESVLVEKDFLSKLQPLKNEDGTNFKETVTTKQLIDLLLVGADCESIVPQRLINESARGDSANKYIELHKFIPRYKSRKVSNQQTIRFLRSQSRANLRRGLDLEGGVEFVISYKKAEDSDYTQDRLKELVRKVISDRVNKSGLTDADVQILGEDKITVTLPAVSQAEKADMRQKILMPAKLEFYEVHPDNGSLAYACVNDPSKIPSNCLLKFIEEENKNSLERRPVLLIKHDNSDQDVRELSGFGFNKDQEIIKEAYYHADPSSGGYVVTIRFSDVGAKAFGSVTERLKPQGNRKRQLAIVLDGQVYSAPTIQNAILNGNCQISGSFSQEEAKMLADVIASGNLPAKLAIDSMNDSPARLGAENVKQGFMAVGIGLLAILLFTTYYYRLCGIIASIALIFNLIVTLGTMAMLGASITMPGVAGLVLGIGMAVDANVLIYERLRDELSNGKSLANAIKASYGRAFWPIFDANITTLITCFVLYRFGTGPIKGFAITLGLGVCASMFSAIFLTRLFLDFVTVKEWVASINMASWFPKKLDLKVLSFAKPAIIFSTILLIASLATAFHRGSDIFGIDFAGGAKLNFEVKQTVLSNNQELPSIEAIKNEIIANKDKFIAGYRLETIRVGYKSGLGTKTLDIVMPSYDFTKNSINLETKISTSKAMGKAMTEEEIKIAKEAEANLDLTIGKIINTKFNNIYENGSYTEVGNLVGADFQKKGLLALGLAALTTIIYLAFRFELAYGFAAVIAVVHDVVISAGIFIIFGGQLSLTVLAALLTILGYSLNDTIVIFDRIREELELYPNKNYTHIIEDAVNSMFARTVLTTLTTFIGVLALLVLGGSSLFEFSVIMLYGLLLGTYSTIYIASYFIVIWHKHNRADDVIEKVEIANSKEEEVVIEAK